MEEKIVDDDSVSLATFFIEIKFSKGFRAEIEMKILTMLHWHNKKLKTFIWSS